MATNNSIIKRTADGLEQIHVVLLKMYDSNVNGLELDQLIIDHYDKDCVFEDPLVITTTMEDFRSQFVALRQLFQSSRIVEHNFFINNEREISMDAVVEYTVLSFWIIKIHQVSRLTLADDDGPKLIVRHEDIWSIASLISSLPIIGWLYDFVYRRLLLGFVLSGFLLMIQPKFSSNKRKSN
mmetsp:Transcript_29005/g.43827  ORF Transcript_29005/g.43827 Transcript_29005/m.43827 type:complete len:182 (-) Transcript_29005:156-701(-)